jgi:riboflavin synthase
VFTGLIETVQPVISSGVTSAGRRICIELGLLAHDAAQGQSISVNGACLTIAHLEGTRGNFDIMPETLKVSTLAHLKLGSRVNLERAMSPTSRLDGHIVQGHIDGTGSIEKIEQNKNAYVLWVSAEPAIMNFMIKKGSVAVDGVSLTIADVKNNLFSVSLIPATLAGTNIADRKAGDLVNLEADIISKWINKRLDQILPKSGSLTMDKLRQQGFS